MNQNERYQKRADMENTINSLISTLAETARVKDGIVFESDGNYFVVKVTMKKDDFDYASAVEEKIQIDIARKKREADRKAKAEAKAAKAAAKASKE